MKEKGSAKQEPFPAAALRELAERLGNARVVARLALLAKDEAAYAKRYRRALEDRNVEGQRIDPWLQLVDALGDADLARGIDWKSAAEDVVGNLRRVAKTKKMPGRALFGFYDEDAHLTTKTLELITFAGRALSAHGIALIELAIDSDSYELTLVRWKEVPALQKLAKRAGGEILLHAPKRPLAAPLAPVAPKKKNAKLVALNVPGVDWVRNPREVGSGVVVHAKAQTTLLDLSTWPPKKVSLGVPNARVAMKAGGGARVVWSIWHPIQRGELQPRPTGTLRVEHGTKTTELLAKLPDHFAPETIGFVGDLVVLLPTEPTVRHGITKRPLVWDGRKLEPARGLRDAKAAKGTRRDPFPSFLKQGFGRLGDGRDFLVWEGKAWLAKGNVFGAGFSIASVSGYPTFRAVPSATGSFYRAAGKKPCTTVLREIVPAGKTWTDVERSRLDGVFDEVETAPDGRCVLIANRYADAKRPALAVFDPVKDAWTMVPATTFGLRKDDPVRAVGFGALKGEMFVWVLDNETVKQLPWSSVR